MYYCTLFSGEPYTVNSLFRMYSKISGLNWKISNNGLKIGSKQSPVLQSYIAQNMYVHYIHAFFVFMNKSWLS